MVVVVVVAVVTMVVLVVGTKLITWSLVTRITIYSSSGRPVGHFLGGSVLHQPILWRDQWQTISGKLPLAIWH